MASISNLGHKFFQRLAGIIGEIQSSHFVRRHGDHCESFFVLFHSRAHNLNTQRGGMAHKNLYKVQFLIRKYGFINIETESTSNGGLRAPRVYGRQKGTMMNNTVPPLNLWCYVGTVNLWFYFPFSNSALFSNSSIPPKAACP